MISCVFTLDCLPNKDSTVQSQPILEVTWLLLTLFLKAPRRYVHNISQVLFFLYTLYTRSRLSFPIVHEITKRAWTEKRTSVDLCPPILWMNGWTSEEEDLEKHLVVVIIVVDLSSFTPRHGMISLTRMLSSYKLRGETDSQLPYLTTEEECKEPQKIFLNEWRSSSPLLLLLLLEKTCFLSSISQPSNILINHRPANNKANFCWFFPILRSFSIPSKLKE